MHIPLLVAVGWIYVTLLMALTQDTILAGLATFLFYGLVPVAILMYLLMTPARRKRRRAMELEAERKAQSDGTEP